ncbi:hypothetical protein [Streptomyces sp. NPDC020996]
MPRLAAAPEVRDEPSAAEADARGRAGGDLIDRTTARRNAGKGAATP